MNDILAVIGGLALACVFVSPVSADEIVAAGAPKVFEGPTGETITVVFLEPKAEGRVLIAFDGVDGEWDGKVFAHKRLVNRDKEDYWLEGEKYVSLVVRNGRWEVYPKGAPKDVGVHYSKDASAKADPSKVIARWQAQQKGASK